MKNEYYNVRFFIHEENYDISMSIFQDYDFCGIEEGVDNLIITFKEDIYHQTDIENLTKELKEIIPETQLLSVEKIGEKNWNEEWESHVQPVFVSEKITITPTHRQSEIDTEIKIIIDPKMSFGTGHHTTTRLMCKLMYGLVKKDSSWVDVGTGTGVLAILAVILGAKSVFAFDNNEWSVENAIENVVKNNVENKITIVQNDIDVMDLIDCDGIAANIFLNLVIPSMAKFRKAIEKNNGDVLISGIMIYDEQIVIREAEKNNLRLIKKIIEDEWVAFHFKVME